jgi:hypothetical protein
MSCHFEDKKIIERQIVGLGLLVSIITFSNISAIYLTEAMGEESLISYITN